MNFTIDKDLFLDALINVSKVASVKSPIRVLEGIKFTIKNNLIEITGYNLEIGMRTEIEVSADSNSEFVIDAKLITDIIRKCDSDEITVTINDERAIIKSGLTEFNISVLSTDEYPELPKVETGSKVTILQSLLKNMLKQTLYAVSNDETKGVLSGELIDIENNILQIIGIDGIRLAVRKETIEDSESKKIIIPGKTLREITSLLKDDDEETCNIIVDERHAIFEIGEYKVYTRLLEGNFPNFHSSVATEFKTRVLVDTDELITAYEKCSVVINDKNKAPAVCKFENGKVYISCKTALGNIKDEVDIEFEGENLEIAINSKFIIEALKNSESDKVWLKMNESNKPIVIVPPVGDSYLFLIMPVNIR